MRREGTARSLGNAPAMGPLTTLWIVVTLAWRLPDPYWLVSHPAVVALVPVQVYVNRINAKDAPNHEVNNRFSALNWLGVAGDGLILILSIAGTLLSKTATSGVPTH